MPDYKKMYMLLFNAATDALARLEEHDPDGAARILQKAQQDTEAIYIDAE